jgi:thymidine phosphorylase
MKTRDDARRLAEALVRVGRAGGKQVRALLTAMDVPLGRAVGNSVEVAEAIAGLRGQGPADLMEVTLRLGEHMLVLGGVADDLTVARTKLEAAIADGSALARFRAIVAAQGGDPGTVDDPSRLPQARFQEALSAPRAGVVVDVDAMKVALGALRLGAGRARASDAVDPAVGISALVQRGERVRAGDALCIVHANDAIALRDAKERLLAAITLGDTAPVLQPLVADVLVA